jgi:ribosome maturation factor RimP
MNGGSRHGSRGQAHPGGRSSGPRGTRGRSGSDKAAAGSAGQDRAGAAKAPAPLPDADRLARLLEPVIHAMGLDLESVRVTAAGRRRLLRVIVDGDGGVSLDTIALASRELAARLDGASDMGELPYTLEVSSPGVDRPLTERRHWRRAVGRLVIAPLTGAAGQHAGNGMAQVEGRIAGASDRGVTLDTGGGLREYSYAELGPGRVQIEFGHLEPGPAEDDDLAELREDFADELSDDLDEPDDELAEEPDDDDYQGEED